MSRGLTFQVVCDGQVVEQTTISPGEFDGPGDPRIAAIAERHSLLVRQLEAAGLQAHIAVVDADDEHTIGSLFGDGSVVVEDRDYLDGFLDSDIGIEDIWINRETP